VRIAATSNTPVAAPDAAAAPDVAAAPAAVQPAE
jgi:hypothetical protein